VYERLQRDYQVIHADARLDEGFSD
jgi:hypothetical protein